MQSLRILALLVTITSSAAAEFQAGAAAVDVSPRKLPVIVNGGFTQRIYDRVNDPLFARALVLSDGSQTLALVVVDSCMIPRDVCDRAKQIAALQTGISPDRILIAATHTHSAPSVMDYCLGSSRDVTYTEQLVPQMAECIALAHSRLQPARAGWTVVDAPQHTACRRWIRRPDRVGTDPFGAPTVRAMMHPGYQNDDYLGPAGPEDSGFSLLAIQTTDGVPLCLLANYSMHYFGWGNSISSDYFGLFAQQLAEKVMPPREGSDAASPPLVAMLSQGTSGDLWRADYAQPQQEITVAEYAQQLVDVAHGAYEQIAFREVVELAMSQTTLSLGRRVPDSQRLDWADAINEARGERPPQNQPEVYAQQARWIHENPQESVVLQAIRIGDLGITAIPNEVYAITGLKLRAQSPLQPTFNISLANGAAGYIPPPEQHALGGYTTWPARTAGLEVQAEPEIVEALLLQLEEVAGRRRRPLAGDLYPAEIRANIDRALRGVSSSDSR